MIPKEKITKQHVLDAISEIDRGEIPEYRAAKGFDLAYNGKMYPPKYVISLATKYAIGKELHPSEFSGGERANNVLRDLGFEIQARAQQSIRDGLQKVMERYVTAPTTGPFGKEHEIWKQFIELQRSLSKLDPIRDNPHIKIAWSVGQGAWTKVPWIALMDDRETDSNSRTAMRTSLRESVLKAMPAKSNTTLCQASSSAFAVTRQRILRRTL